MRLKRKRNNVTQPNCYCAEIACDKCNSIGNREGVMESTIRQIAARCGRLLCKRNLL